MGFRNFAKRLKTKIVSLFTKRKRAASKRKRLRVLLPEAQELLEAPNHEKGGYLDLPLVPVIGAIDEFSVVQLSAHTQRAYKKDLADYFAFLRTLGVWEHWNFETNPTHVAAFRTYLLETRKLSKSSVTRKLAVLKSFYKWCKARGWMKDNPAELVKSFPQTQESKTGFLSESEIYKLLDAFAPLEHLSLFQALCKVSVETLLMLGVRRSEAAQIKVADLEHLDGRWLVKVQGKGDRNRTLPLPPRLADTWSKWLRRLSSEAPLGAGLDENPTEWIGWIRRNGEQPLLVSSRATNFHTALSSSELARIVRKSARKALLPNRVSPHVLRATAITYALDQGASNRGVQQMAGWTSPLMITRYDKRRKDPRFSAILHLKYAQKNKNEVLQKSVNIAADISP